MSSMKNTVEQPCCSWYRWFGLPRRGPTAILAGLCLASLIPATGLAGGTVKLITSASIPPYVIVDKDRGIVTDLMREAFVTEGDALQLVYATNRRAEEELLNRHVDGLYNIPCAAGGTWFYSQPLVEYQNVVVTLESAHLEINNLRDLADTQLVAFQNAPLFLGPDFGAMARTNPNYQEVSHQALQVEMLFGGHAQAIVLDRRIFMYYFRRSATAQKSADHYVIHSLFPLMTRCAAFNDKDLRDALNRGLRKLRENGDYQRIVARYVAEP